MSDTLLAVGPDAPTLSHPWRTSELTAHLVLRETRPDLSIGQVVPPLRGRLDRALQERAADGLQLAVLTVQLEVMLVTTFLLALGVPAAKVGEAVRAFGAYNWIRNHLAVRPDDG